MEQDIVVDLVDGMWPAVCGRLCSVDTRELSRNKRMLQFRKPTGTKVECLPTCQGAAGVEVIALEGDAARAHVPMES